MCVCGRDRNLASHNPARYRSPAHPREIAISHPPKTESSTSHLSTSARRREAGSPAGSPVHGKFQVRVWKNPHPIPGKIQGPGWKNPHSMPGKIQGLPGARVEKPTPDSRENPGARVEKSTSDAREIPRPHPMPGKFQPARAALLPPRPRARCPHRVGARAPLHPGGRAAPKDPAARARAPRPRAAPACWQPK